ncbi:enhanced serine sensitivity protein SseB C-terminal domain-containing protein [Solirubrum puertoriconensis]|uniref:SseB protein N-terminal domain-containing protein n=1 Tax=Solirubrum puertoriconensis TaxID=1751427 RepID=A0A9X0HMM8_SOLP1|nr:enhanced serine sensitivity protein SseB C-terminal domain-containing protein [Solirubrum puertoriconensis]KUG08738.1 hypothetical protein ASU33_11415 [Solirubrum puertoriconensis]
MGLFDFLKKKPADEAAETPAPSQPATTSPATSTPEPEASKTAGGPRYQRPAFAAKSAAEMQPAAPAMSSMPEIPPMPELPPMPPFDPKNNLESALLMASQDPQYRLAFYHELLNAEVLVLTAIPEGGQPGEMTVEEGTEVQLQVLHDGRIPMFSSEERIYEGGAQPEQVAFLRVRGEGFLHMTHGAECVLNPFSPYGKLLVLPEIEDLLSGRIFSPPAEEQQGPQAQLVPMAEHPAELKAALEDFCAQHPHIEAVYLSDVLIEGEEAPTRMLLAFKVDGEDMEFLQELGPILQAHLPGQDTMDVARLSPDPNEPLTQYFNQQEPVYQRTLV